MIGINAFIDIWQRRALSLERLPSFEFGILIFGTGTAFPNPGLRSFEVFHGLKSKQDYHAIENMFEAQVSI